jgi:hypothetical protein
VAQFLIEEAALVRLAREENEAARGVDEQVELASGGPPMDKAIAGKLERDMVFGRQ